MNFLLLETVTFLIEKALRALLLSLCDVVYRLIIIFYDIFIKIGTVSILDNPTINEMYRKIGLILGFFMVLRLSFSAITYLINPDLISDKKKGYSNIIKKIVVVVVLLGITPSLFSEAFKLQGYIVKQNIIGKIITGENDKFSDDQGKNLAWFGFSSFYKPYSNFDGYKVDGHDMGENDIINECPTLRDFNEDGIIRRAIIANNDFKFAYRCINTTIEAKYGNEEVDLFVVDFDGSGIVCFIVGILLLWLILMYTIQLGVRLLQLAYLQLIAPIPIMMYLTPKGDESLTKWYKQCLTTFLDFFIRTSIMFFAIYIIQFLTNLNSPFMSWFDNLGASKVYVAVVMIIAILIFVKRVPKLLEDVFPSLKNAASLDFGLKPPKEFKQVTGAIAGATAAGAIGLIGGGPGLGNKLKGLAGGVTKGGFSGFKGNKLKDIASARAAINLKNRQIREDENTTFAGRTEARMRNMFGFETIPSTIDLKIKEIDEKNIKPLNDEKKRIDMDPTMLEKKSNDKVIGYFKSMMDEAEKELLKTDTSIIGFKNNLDYIKEHFGETVSYLDSRGNLVTNRITGDIIANMQEDYKNKLKAASETWIDTTGRTNEVIVSNLSNMSNELGRTVSDYAHAKAADDASKQRNVTIAPRISDLEYRKVEIDREIENYERQKEALNESKKRPQADLDAINKKK